MKRFIVSIAVMAEVLVSYCPVYAGLFDSVKSIAQGVADAAGEVVDTAVSATTNTINTVSCGVTVKSSVSKEVATNVVVFKTQTTVNAVAAASEADQAKRMAAEYLAGEFTEKTNVLIPSNDGRYRDSVAYFWTYVDPGCDRSKFGPCERVYANAYPGLPNLIRAGGGAILPTTTSGATKWIAAVRKSVAREESLKVQRDAQFTQQKLEAERREKERLAMVKMAEQKRLADEKTARATAERREGQREEKRVADIPQMRQSVVRNDKVNNGATVAQSPVREHFESASSAVSDHGEMAHVCEEKQNEAFQQMDGQPTSTPSHKISGTMAYCIVIPVFLVAIFLYGGARSKVSAGELVCYAGWLDLFGSIAWLFCALLGAMWVFGADGSGFKVAGWIVWGIGAASFLWLFVGAFVYNRNTSWWYKVLAIGSRIIVAILFMFAIAQLQQKLKDLQDDKKDLAVAVKGALVALAVFAFIYKCLVKPMIGRHSRYDID